MIRKSPRSGAASSVRVAVRFRPLLEEEKEEGIAFAVRPEAHTRIVDSVDLHYSFELDRAFGAEASQAQVYAEVGRPAVGDVLMGYNGTVLAYGQTGSGKTYCMFGPSLEQPTRHGLIPRAVRQIFDAIRSGSDDVRFVLRCSLLEVYCDELRDLLDPSNHRLRIQETPQKGVFVDGLTQECVTCEEDVLGILHTGVRMRVVASTKMNQISSRSHVIFFLSCEQQLPNGANKVAKLSLADLAGSERAMRSGALSAGGARLQEMKKINCSLSALGQIIQALSEKHQHVPYRNSQLTRVLQETIGGNCKTALVVTCSAGRRHASETLSSLRFATRARSVCNHVKVNLIHSAEQLTCLVGQLQRELAAARREASQLSVNVPRSLSLESLAADALRGGEAGSPEASGSDDSDKSRGEIEDEEEALALFRRAEEEVRELQEALEAQGEHVASALAAAAAAAAEAAVAASDEGPSGAARLEDSAGGSTRTIQLALVDFLACCSRRSELQWRLAGLRFEEDVAAADLATEDACANRHEEELADIWKENSFQRLWKRRQEAQQAALADAGAAAAAVEGMSVGGDVVTMPPSASHWCSWIRPRPSLGYLSTSTHRGSKVVVPVSRRSVERGSVSGTSPSSGSSTPLGGTPRGGVATSPAVLAEAALAARATSPRSPLLPHSSCLLAGDASPGEAASPPPPQPGSAGQPPSSSPRSFIASASATGQGSSSGGNGDDERSLRAKIDDLHAERERRRQMFEEKCRQSEETFSKFMEEVAEHLRQLEFEHRDTCGAIPRLRRELEEADMALEEAELQRNATELDKLRLGRQVQRQHARLNARRQQYPDDAPDDFERALNRTAATARLLSRSLTSASDSGAMAGGSGAATPLPTATATPPLPHEVGSRRPVAAAVEKENEPPAGAAPPSQVKKYSWLSAAPRQYGSATVEAAAPRRSAAPPVGPLRLAPWPPAAAATVGSARHIGQER